MQNTFSLIIFRKIKFSVQGNIEGNDWSSVYLQFAGVFRHQRSQRLVKFGRDRQEYVKSVAVMQDIGRLEKNE